MPDRRHPSVRVIPAAPDDLVSFSVICQPRSRAGLAELRTDLSLQTLRRFLPTERVRAGVEAQLRDLGFEVFSGQSAVVSARGSVALFQSLFGGRFDRRIQRRSKGSQEVDAAVVLRRGSRTSARRVTGALQVVVMEPPVFEDPLIPDTAPQFSLRLPGDIALLTKASATHRQPVASGDRATGGHVVVAVLDTGFSLHPYFAAHGYRINRVSASDQPGPATEDPASHGTRVLSSLLACAPDVNAWGIRMGANPVVALTDAMSVPGLKVVSLSWAYFLGRKRKLPAEHLPLQAQILLLVDAGITVVASAGNAFTGAFPAMMPEVIAVGGVEARPNDTIRAWSTGASFTSAIYAGRRVPDLCGIASRMTLPGAGPPPGWASSSGGTSNAAPQVAGIAALLLQKQPALTPTQVRARMTSTALDVTSGADNTGHTATVGPDLATGAGFVNALDAWNHP